ncbi:porin [Paraburkholderia sp. CI3]|uniref:porin n=1 Tax=Paraburkholderia sp. CI3 TaxID=2991060 RepID=UPI003D1FCFB9
MAAALLLAFANSAVAQSNVTLFGYLDEAVQMLTRADGHHASVSLTNYGQVMSQFGIRGAEDLGNGYQALFLINPFLLNGGQIAQTFVGISSPYGTVTLGEQKSILFEQALWFDPLLAGAYSAQSADVVPRYGFLISNSIKYKSVPWNGLTVNALLGLGDRPDGFSAGRTVEAAAEYDFRQFGITLAYQKVNADPQQEGPTMAGRTGTKLLGAGRYAFSRVTAYGGLEHSSGDMEPRRTMVWTGVRVDVTPALNLQAAVYRANIADDGGHPTLWVVGTSYSLSRRTSLYATLGHVVNAANAAQTVYAFDPEDVCGKTQTGLMLGMLHAF